MPQFSMMISPSNGTQTRLFELDAVRAFAVIVVVLYHVKTPGFNFGYLGVDVFFVLSGYLMTRNVIIDQQNNGQASVLRFVKKRFLRIVPPLIVVALTTMLVSLLLYSPTHLLEVGQQVFSAITFHSNLYFYDQAGYFAPENELRPMLHSWSLAVEEQFYILFALLILLSKSVRFQTLIIWAFIISITLYGALCFQTLNSGFEINWFWPEKANSEDALFYLTPFRMIQFLSGACMALIHGKFRPAVGIKLGSLFFIVAICLLCVIDIYKILNFSNLVAALAAIMLLQKNEFIARVGRLISVKFIAKSSYQIYLVHWPLIVFWRYITFNELGVLEQIILVGLSVFFGWGLMKFTYHITNPSRWSLLPKYIKLTGILICIVTLGFAGLIIQSKGYPSRIPVDRDFVSAAEHRAQENEFCNGSHLGPEHELGSRPGDPLVTCEVNPKGSATIYVFGDSHARHLISGLSKRYPNSRIAVIYFSSCHAQSGLVDYVYDYEGRTALKAACLARNADAMKLFAKEPPATIIIHQFAGYHSDSSSEFFEASDRLLDQLESFGHSVIWLGSVVRPNKLMDGCNYLPITFPANLIDSRCEGDKKTAQKILSYTKTLEAKFPKNYLGMSSFFCSNNQVSLCSATLNGKPLFRDKHHLTVFGSEQFIDFAITHYPDKFPVPNQ